MNDSVSSAASPLYTRLSREQRRLILLAVAIGTFMAPLDASVVNIALPKIGSFFHAPLRLVEWVIMSYLLVISSLLLTYGRLGDMYGHKKIYVTGFIFFTIGSLLCGLAPSIMALIFARAFQALGAGMMMAMGPAIVTATSPPQERGRSMSTIAVAVSVALTTGPILGGFLTSHFGWRSIFLINLPIGVIASFLAWRTIPETGRKEKQPFDLKGAALFFAALTSILLSLSYVEKAGWKNPRIWLALTGGLFLLLLFILLEKKIPAPMLDLSLFKIRLFSLGNLSALLNYIAQYSVVFLMPFYLQQQRHLDPSHAGLLLIPMPLTTMVIAPISGILSDKFDVRYLSSAGMGITAFGLWQLSRLTVDSPTSAIILALVTVGLGTGLFQTPNNSAIMGSVPKNRLGIASSVLATMRNVGMVTGVAITGAVFSTRYNSLLKTYAAQGIGNSKVLAFSGAMHTAYLVATCLALLAVFTSLSRGSLNVATGQADS
ncbi:MAG: hypothetical protein PWQ91_789 [Eubacteriales bacterium]|nr:hypothetical protein [Eubacteriales bacterium]MDN5363728.1 hypothetical protein [Eubacteriales bacterium]